MPLSPPAVTALARTRSPNSTTTKLLPLVLEEVVKQLASDLVACGVCRGSDDHEHDSHSEAELRYFVGLRL